MPETYAAVEKHRNRLLLENADLKADLKAEVEGWKNGYDVVNAALTKSQAEVEKYEKLLFWLWDTMGPFMRELADITESRREK